MISDEIVNSEAKRRKRIETFIHLNYLLCNYECRKSTRVCLVQYEMDIRQKIVTNST